MDKAVDFFSCKKKRRINQKRSNIERAKKAILNVLAGINVMLVASLLLNKTYLKNLVLNLGTNIVPVKKVNITAKDFSKLYPALNIDNYVIAKREEVSVPEEEIKEIKEEIKINDGKFDGSAVDAFSFSKNDAANLKISYTTNYQKATLYGITITNYSEMTDIDYVSIMNKEVTLNRGYDKVLLYCTHTSESYVNSEGYTFEYTGTMRTKDAKYNMLSVASVLQDTLMQKGINTILDTTPHDYTSYDNAYTNSRKTIQNQLNENGKFGLTIDVHRDAYGSLYNGPTVEINGKDVALIMIVVGVGAEGYENPYWETNLALAMKIMKKGEEMYPGLFRPMLIRDSKYNQDMNCGAILTEVGTTGNTHEQVYYAVTCLGNILNEVFD